MSKTKQRLSSVLLTLCLTLALCAGFVLAAPVKAKAVITNVDNYSFPISVAPGDVVTLSFRYTYDDVPAASTHFNLYQTDSSGASNIGPISQFTLTEIGVSDIISSNTSLTFTAPTAGIYYYILRWGPVGQPAYGRSDVFTLYVGVTPPSAPATTPVPPAPADADEYTLRHYNYWLPVHARLMRLGNSGNVTVNTDGENLDHIQYFVFDALVGTNRTLTVHHRGETYVIRGAPETEGGMMRTIRLGQNHLFVGNLDNYMI